MALFTWVERGQLSFPVSFASPRARLTLAFAPSLGGAESAALRRCLCSDLGDDWRSAPAAFLLLIGSCSHVRARGWNSELWLLALLFLFLFFFKIAGSVELGWAGCLALGEAGDRLERATGQTEVAKKSLPRCSVREPGPQLQAATI